MFAFAFALAADLPSEVPLVGKEPPPALLRSAQITTVAGVTGFTAGVGMALLSPRSCNLVACRHSPLFGAGLLTVGAGGLSFLTGVALHTLADRRERALDVAPLAVPGGAGVAVTVRQRREPGPR